MQVQSEQSEPTPTENLDQIEADIARYRKRCARAQAEEAENRTRNRDRIETAEGHTAEATARKARNDDRRGWIWMIVMIALVGYSSIGGSSTPTAGVAAIDESASTAATTAWSSEGDDGLMKTKPPKEHLSSSTVEAEAELIMLKHLGKDEGVELKETGIAYNGAKMLIDGVDSDRTIFVEAFARMGRLKDGQQKKVAIDALKFVALKTENPDARFVLAFADQKASDSVVGWVRAVLDEHGIKRVVVPIPKTLERKLLATQANQKTGMETAG